jgi:predicted secreted protein
VRAILAAFEATSSQVGFTGEDVSQFAADFQSAMDLAVEQARALTEQQRATTEQTEDQAAATRKLTRETERANEELGAQGDKFGEIEEGWRRATTAGDAYFNRMHERWLEFQADCAKAEECIGRLVGTGET